MRSVLHCTIKFLWLCLHWQAQHWLKQSLEPSLSCGSQMVHSHSWFWVCSPIRGTGWLHQPLVFLRSCCRQKDSWNYAERWHEFGFSPCLTPHVTPNLSFTQALLQTGWSWGRLELVVNLGTYLSTKGVIASNVRGKMHKAWEHQKPFKTW